MKIRNLLVMAITLAFGTLCAAAQTGDGSKTFTDDTKQSITISRFGTVLSFADSNGKKSVPNDAYRVCLCGEKSPCTKSATAPSEKTKSELEGEFPKQGTPLKTGETLVLTATFHKEELTVERRLTWVAGYSLVRIDETISSSKALCVLTLAKKGLSMQYKMCPRPPGFAVLDLEGFFICPPPNSLVNPEAEQIRVNYILEFSHFQ